MPRSPCSRRLRERLIELRRDEAALDAILAGGRREGRRARGADAGRSLSGGRPQALNRLSRKPDSCASSPIQHVSCYIRRVSTEISNSGCDMMRINKLAAAVLLGVSALGLSACATGLQTKVSRYQAMPAPQGQSFVVVPIEPATTWAGSNSRATRNWLRSRCRRRAMPGRRRSTRRRWSSASAMASTTATPKSSAIPSMAAMAATAAGAIRGYYGRRGYYWGWNDPFWYGGYGGGNIRSYTYYVSELDLDIRRKVDNASLFEGKAKARSRTDELSKLVPSLVDAMFTGFPGSRAKRSRSPSRPTGSRPTLGY